MAPLLPRPLGTTSQYDRGGSDLEFPQEVGIARYGEPEEIAELMAFLVSPGARWMTVSTLRIDGGEVKSI